MPRDETKEEVRPDGQGGAPDDGLPNLEGLAERGNPDDLLLGIELRLREGPSAHERRELMLRAARLCNSELVRPNRARQWLQRFMAPAPQVAVTDEEFRALCEQVGAADLLELPEVVQAQEVLSSATQATEALASSAPQVIELPSWVPFWRRGLVWSGVWCLGWGIFSGVIAVSGTQGLAWFLSWGNLMVFLLGCLSVLGLFYWMYLWPTNPRTLELTKDEFIIRDGRGRVLHREPRDQLRPDVGWYDTMSVRMQVVQLVGVGVAPVILTCVEEGHRHLAGASNRLERPRHKLDRETWDRLVLALNVADD